MGFKRAAAYNEQKYGNKFILQNDGDYADVVFLYQSQDDVLIADAHYIKSATYNGYCHCLGAGCPACEKHIRIQPKLFIPLYNISTGQIEFWDRTPVILPQITKDVFTTYPNPSDFVFRITRHGESGDRGTRYQIMAVAKNKTPYAELLKQANAIMPDYYENIIKDASVADIAGWLTTSSSSSSVVDVNSLPDYTPTPRVSVAPTTPNPIASSIDALANVGNLDEFTAIDEQDGEPNF